MSIQNDDLLLVQRGDTPYKETADNLATYINGKIDFPTFPDAIVFQGLWDQPDTAPSDREAGYLWIWSGGRETLNDAGDDGWVGINGESITVNDRIYYNGSAFEIFTVSASDDQDLDYRTAADEGTVTITNGTNATIPIATDSIAGLMSAADKASFDSLVASGGLTAVVAGDGILVDTTENGSAGAPEVSVNFGAVRDGQNPVTVMPYDISMLAELPD